MAFADLCPDCSSEVDLQNKNTAQVATNQSGSLSPVVDRRGFVQVAGVTSVAASMAGVGGVLSGTAFAKDAASSKPNPKANSESLVKSLYESLNDKQREVVCFDWNHVDKRRGGLLRRNVQANWQITKPRVNSSFFTKDQQDLVEAIFWGLYSPEWKERIGKQLRDDAGGYGKSQAIALFGTPGSGKFEFVMTGRHLTVRCDGDSTKNSAFGGPIFYGHAPKDEEDPNHTGNVFWHQGVKANKLFEMFDGKQRKLALVPEAPAEDAINFRVDDRPGLRLSELSSDQMKNMQGVLETLLEPYRAIDRKEAVECLKQQGGLEKCNIAFYESDDIGDDKVWDSWRLEGPSFVWHYRGDPHVHVWVNVASDPSIKITTG